MNQKSKVLSLARKGLNEVELEIAQQEKERNIAGTLLQLQSFRRDLEAMIEQLQGDQLPSRDRRNFGIGYTIIDSWEGSLDLGELLLSIEQAYRKL